MTSKKYYEDQYRFEFETNIVKQDSDDQGDYLVLEETYFYPTGGGQPCDLGEINTVPVVAVEEVEGEIRHYVEKPIQAKSGISCKIDWARRFDHMQQHSGQHILTAAWVESFGIETVSFHLGEEYATIDLAVESLTEEMIHKVEKVANEVVTRNEKIESKWITEDDISLYPLRKAPSVSENIRLVIIKDFDYNACGGTHPTRTGEVGLIKITNWERNKKNTIRVQFVCGNRVSDLFTRRQKVVRELVQLVNHPEHDVPHAVHQLLETKVELEKSLLEANEKLLSYEVKQYVEQSIKIGNYHLIAQQFEHYAMKDLQKLSQLIVNQNERNVVLLVAENEEKLQMVCACGKNVEVKMNELLKDVLPLIDGKGGGNPYKAQGGGKLCVTAEEMVNLLQKRFTEQVPV